MIQELKFNEICEKIGVNPIEVKERRNRKTYNVLARYMYFQFLYEEIGISLIEIGKQFHPKYDHTTVIHGIKSIKCAYRTLSYEHLLDIYVSVKTIYPGFTSLNFFKKK